MKQILLILLGVAVLYFVGFGVFATKSEVIVPEIRPTNNYDRPLKDDKCYIQKDNAGNKIRVCG